MNILAKFHQEITIFDEVRGHLLILLIYRALTRASEGLLREKAAPPGIGLRYIHTDVTRL